MTDVFNMAAQRTPLRIINGSPLASRSRPADDPYVNVGESGISTDVSGIVKDVDVACSSSSCVRSPRSRLSPPGDRRQTGEPAG